jgi:predicted translin family RNA/ssDNA-binding protein
LQEYIEAISFMHYLKEKRLITKEEVQELLKDEQTGEEVSALS